MTLQIYEIVKLRIYFSSVNIHVEEVLRNLRIEDYSEESQYLVYLCWKTVL